jgi:N-acetylneuraminic acid mutarotase
MKKTILLFITVFFFSLISFSQWTIKADFGGAERKGAVGFSIGNKGYIGTGGYSDFWEYDPDTDTWTQKAGFPGPGGYYAVGFSIGNKGYIGTGEAGANSFKDFWEYDPASDTWTQKADFGGVARKNAVGFSIGNKGYIGTGIDSNNTFLKDFWEYDPATDTWTQKADFGGIARICAIGFSVGSKGYIGTGLDSSGLSKEFWEYDPATDTWTQKSDFGGVARYQAACFSIGLKGYIGTGVTANPSTQYLIDFWEYDQASDTWTQRSDFGGWFRSYAVGFSIGSKGYMGTGWYYMNPPPTIYKDLWEYDPSVENITEATDNIEINIFPSPANDKIIIEVPPNSFIEIADITGHILESINSKDLKQTINVANLANGLYIVRARTDKEIVTKKFNKE